MRNKPGEVYQRSPVECPKNEIQCFPPEDVWGVPCGSKYAPATVSGAQIFPERVDGAMYIHMFAFRFKAGVTETQKEQIVSEIRELQSEIPAILETWVGQNESPRGDGYELGGAMKFRDKAACQAYGRHPVHQKLLGWLMPLIEPIEVDFEYRERT
jgi:Stress responsive A/B Barrel Domain